MVHDLAYGTTEPQDFEVETRDLNGVTEEDLSGSSVASVITSLASGSVVDDAGTAAWLDVAAKRWRFEPTGTLPRGRYAVRLAVTLSSGKVFFVPTGREPDQWNVYQP